MKRVRICSFLIFSAFCLVAACSCEVDCGCDPEPQSMDKCECFDTSQDVLMVADFENEGLPNDCGGYIQAWQDSLSFIETWAKADTIGGGAQGSNWYAKLNIVGNDGASPAKWTGGGLVVQLIDCPDGIDLSDYDSLLFEVKTFSNSSLGETRVKLQDVENDSIPERLLLLHGKFPAEGWQTISIPLTEFNVKYASDTILHNWVPLDRSRVKSLVTTVINNQSSSVMMDGILLVDNIRFLKD